MTTSSWKDTCQGCGLQGHVQAECPFARSIRVMQRLQEIKIREREEKAPLSNPWKGPTGKYKEQAMEVHEQGKNTQTHVNGSGLLSTKEAASLLGVDRHTIYNWVKTEILPVADRKVPETGGRASLYFTVESLEKAEQDAKDKKVTDLASARGQRKAKPKAPATREKELLTVSGVARRIDLTLQSVYYWMEKGWLVPSAKDAKGKLLFTMEAVEQAKKARGKVAPARTIAATNGGLITAEQASKKFGLHRELIRSYTRKKKIAVAQVVSGARLYDPAEIARFKDWYTKRLGPTGKRFTRRQSRKRLTATPVINGTAIEVLPPAKAITAKQKLVIAACIAAAALMLIVTAYQGVHLP